MKELPTRKNIRLDSFDYRANALYFITICTKEKNPLLWEYAELINIGYFDKVLRQTDYKHKDNDLVNPVGAFISRKSEISEKWSQSCGLLTDCEQVNNNSIHPVGATVSQKQSRSSDQRLLVARKTRKTQEIYVNYRNTEK